MLYTFRVPSIGCWFFYLAIQRASLLETEKGKTVLGSYSLAAQITSLLSRALWHLHRWEGTTHQTRAHWLGHGHLFLLGAVAGVGNPDRYFCFMQFHFCLDLSDPLIL